MGSRNGFVGWSGLRGSLPEALKRFPYAADSRLAVLELLDRAYARQAVPNLDQACRWPVYRQFVQPGFASEGFGVRHGFGVLNRSVNRDVVRLIFNREDFHGVYPLRGSAAVTFITWVAGHNQANCEGNRRGR
jgi:hypothetical protein